MDQLYPLTHLAASKICDYYVSLTNFQSQCHFLLPNYTNFNLMDFIKLMVTSFHSYSFVQEIQDCPVQHSDPFDI
jgi:hypothetical protein